MPTHREILEKRAADALAAYTRAGAESERLIELVKVEQAAIAQLTADHAEACRKIASGQDAGTASILTEKARRSDRLHGLESLLKDANDKLAALTPEYLQTARELEAETDRDELAKLEEAITAANAKAAEIRASLKEAEQAATKAVWERTRFLRMLELKQKSVA